MRYIPISKLKETFDKLKGKEGAFDDWVTEAEEHLKKIRPLGREERSKYWAKNNFWKELYPALSALSDNKCWYSEAPESSSEWEIEHYRPKSKSIGENGAILKEDGYWWLSYHWKNFRLAGSLINKLRKDRFDLDNDEVYGKGNFFPLQNAASVAKDEDNLCECETPLLVDPINPRDVILISFDKNGEPFPTYDEKSKPLEFKKAILSIKYYGLNHTPLKRGRKKIWDQCEALVDRANNFLKSNIHDEQKRARELDTCYLQLATLSSRESPYSAVVRSFINIRSKEPNFGWLQEAVQILQ